MSEVTSLVLVAISMSAVILIPLAVNGVLAASFKLCKQVCVRLIPRR